ncbi:Cof-type HAD-IIB family hydrolase [Lactobacillus terrae]|uniref:Cof-type HAD-IIB family hydrolase n=1 Tax=Lactobacillus terrae TaxID=2269374 RepID=UPI000C1B707B|nr:Cof-type HAD-IIB family hydrolase [Lactobacillus terrae]
MQNNYKGSVFFDLDGTLFNNQTKIDKDVADAVHQLRANNYLPVISTGRSFDEAQDAAKPTGIDTLVTLNGAYVKHQDDVIYKSVMDTDVVSHVIDKVDELDDFVGLHSATDTRLIKSSDTATSFYNMVNIKMPKIDSDFHLNNEIPMMIIISEDDIDRYSEFFDALNFYKTGKYSIDVVNKNVTKMTGIQHILKTLDLEDKPTYAFGDGANDIPMLSSVGHGIAMGNGSDQAKEAAEYTTSENINGGIANGLKHYGLI